MKKTPRTGLFRLWIVCSGIWILCCCLCIGYHVIEERDFAKKAEFTLKLHKAFPQDGWAREGATLETETQRNERKWNKFVMLMAGLTIACPVIVLIIGRGILWINEGFKRVKDGERVED